MTDDSNARPGIDPELLAAYVDNRLPPDQRAEVEARLAADPESYELLVEVMETQEALDAQARVAEGRTVPFVPKVRTARRWVLAGSVLATAAALVLVVRLQPDLLTRLRGGDSVDPRFEKLVSAVGEQRYIEARLTGGFKHGPLQSATRGPVAPSQQNLALLAAAGELQKKAQAEPSAENLHSWGAAALLVGQLDEGVRALEQASTIAESNARIQADLSAAYLARAQSESRPADLPRALAAAERALRIDDSLLEAHFNRALALELLHLTDQATAAWRAYAERDPSAWGEEARAKGARPRAARAEEQWRVALSAYERNGENLSTVVRSSPERAVRLGEMEWPAEWAAKILANDHEGARVSLARMTTLGSALDQQLGDPLVAHFSQFVQLLPAASRVAVASSVGEYVRARKLIEEYRFADAAAQLSNTSNHMSAQKNPLAWIALLEYAGALRSSRQIDAAQALIPRVIDGSAPYQSVSARAHRLRGLLQIARGKYTDALTDYGIAIGLFQRSGLRLIEAQTATLVAEALRVVGSKEIWKYQELALRTEKLGATARELQPVYFTAGVTALSEDLPEAAQFFFTAMVAEAEQVGVPAAIAEARLSRARAYLALGAHAELEADLAAANSLLDSGPASAHAEFVRGEWTAVRAERLANSDPVEALQAAEYSLEYAAKTRRTSLIPRMRLAQGRALVKVNRLDEAAAAFQHGITAFEAQWANVSQDALRISHFDRAWDLYGDLAVLQAGRDQPISALSTLERSQARSLLRARDVSGRGWTQARLEAALRQGAAIVYWLPAERVTYAWVIRRSGTLMVQVAVSRAEVEAAQRSPQALEQLGTQLLQPLAAILSDASAIGFVAPGVLSQIPWAAVRVAGDQRLVDRATVQLLPNTLMALNARRTGVIDQPRALVVAASSELRDGVESLADLPRARSEAAAVASYYTHHTVLVDESASAAAVLAEFQSHTVFHFAGHAISNEATPELSRLVLSQGETISGRDLSVLEGSKVRLAVLTACSTASGAVARSEGSISIARMLLSKGVDTVVASLFPVSDSLASRFGLLFHQGLVRGMPAAEALRDAQRELNRDAPQGDLGWSGFVLVGGNGLFVEGGVEE